MPLVILPWLIGGGAVGFGAGYLSSIKTSTKLIVVGVLVLFVYLKVKGK